jgi:hypothetical protein
MRQTGPSVERHDCGLGLRLQWRDKESDQAFHSFGWWFHRARRRDEEFRSIQSIQDCETLLCKDLAGHQARRPRPRRGLRRSSVPHRGIVVVALGPQTQPRVAPLAMVAAQKRAEMPSCPANGCWHAPQRLSASGVMVSAERSVLVGLGAVTSLTCPSSVYSIGGRRGPAMQMVEVDEVWQRVTTV